MIDPDKFADAMARIAEVDKKDTIIRDLKRQLSEAEATRDALAAALLANGVFRGAASEWHSDACLTHMVHAPACNPECVSAVAALRRAKAL